MRSADKRTNVVAHQSEQASNQSDAYPGSLQENILTLMFFFPKNGKKVVERIDAELFEGDYALMAERCIAHWKKYNKPPGEAHCVDLFDDVGDRRHQTITRVITNMFELKTKIDPEFVVDQLGEFTRLQTLKGSVLTTAEQINSGRPGASQEVLDTMRAALTDAPSVGRQLTTRSFEEFEPREMRWTWEPFIPAGMITLLFGDGEVGKSTICNDVAARITKGRPWPQFGDDPEVRARLGSVLILSKEDNPNLIIRPRLEAAGADIGRVHAVGYDASDDFEPIDRLDTTVAELERLIVDLGDVRLIVIDPITDFIGERDMYRDDSVRALLNPLGRLAAKYELAVVIVLHLNKKQDLAARYRGMGSIAFRNVARSSILVSYDKDEEGARKMQLEKANLVAEKLAVSFHISSTRLGGPRIKWHREWQEADVEDALNDRGPTKQGKAEKLLREWLAKGPLLATELHALADESGISWRTFEIVKKTIGVVSRKGEDGKWEWDLE